MQTFLAPLLKWFLLVVALLYFGRFVFKAYVLRIRSYTVLGLLANCYVLGKASQYWFFIPRFVRWYLSDIGFVACGAYFCLEMAVLYGSDAIWMAKFGARVALFLAMGVEFLQMAANAQLVKSGNKFSARGDWVDMAIFVVTYFIVMGQIRQFERIVRQRPKQRTGKGLKRRRSKQ